MALATIIMTAATRRWSRGPRHRVPLQVHPRLGVQLAIAPLPWWLHLQGVMQVVQYQHLLVLYPRLARVAVVSLRPIDRRLWWLFRLLQRYLLLRWDTPIIMTCLKASTAAMTMIIIIIMTPDMTPPLPLAPCMRRQRALQVVLQAVLVQLAARVRIASTL